MRVTPTFCVLVAQGALSHICQLDGSFRASVHEPVAAQRVELGGSYDLRKLFHVRWFDIHDVETLVLYVQIPKVNSQIITTNESLAVTVYRYAVDVICVCIRVRLAGDGGNNGIVMGQPRELQVGSCAEVDVRIPHWPTATRNSSRR